MTPIGLFILSVSALVTIWTGQQGYVFAGATFFVAAAVTDLISTLVYAVHKHYAISNMEVVLNGLAQGSETSGIRDEIGRAARKAWEQAQRAEQGKGN